MAREFAKSFYKSKDWKLCRAAVFERDKGLCQSCLKKGKIQPGEEVHHKVWLKPSNITNPFITVNPSNLELLCKDCHFAIHRQVQNDIRHKRLPSINNGYYFDDKGEVRKVMTYIVYGSPGAGKTTYVRNHRQYGDIVIDLDILKESISMDVSENAPDNITMLAIKLRDTLYEVVKHKQTGARTVWVIASLPKRSERNKLCIELDAELIFIDSDIETCMENVLGDTSRVDKEKHMYLIDKWFGAYER